MATTINEVEARTRIGDLLRQVAETGEPVYVEWEGRLQAAIVAANAVPPSPGDWRSLLAEAQTLIQRDLAGRPLPDIDELINGGRDERDDSIIADLRRR